LPALLDESLQYKIAENMTPFPVPPPLDGGPLIAGSDDCCDQSGY